MKYTVKKISLASISLLAAALCCLVAWRLVPPSADGIRESAVIVEQAAWQEVCADGKPLLYFSSAAGDSALLGVTANRDSALHRRRIAGCWINRWAVIPSCEGRILTARMAAPRAPRVKGDTAILAMCRASVARQLATLKAQKSELDYYLRVHGVQDNGYQTIAALAARLNRTYDDVARAGRLIDSVAAGKGHRLAIRAAVGYAAIFRDDSARIVRKPLHLLAAGNSGKTMTLQTADRTTPPTATPLSPLPWQRDRERDIRAVGFPGLGEQGLECDTISPVIIPGRRLRGARHDFPRILVSDGSPVFTAGGMFLGITAGDNIASK